MNPTQVAQNRTARLVREAQTPVYTTETKPREHVYMVEMEHEDGYRKWVSEDEANRLENLGYFWSDRDHSLKCWCFK